MKTDPLLTFKIKFLPALKLESMELTEMNPANGNPNLSTEAQTNKSPETYPPLLFNQVFKVPGFVAYPLTLIP
jgi:hypothetical protein